MSDVGILGGTGPAGRALAARLAAAGAEVTIGSRHADRGTEIALEIIARWPEQQLAITGGDNTAAAAADLVVVAAPWEAAAATAGGLAEQLSGKVVISMANALARVGEEFQALVPARGSIAVAVQAAVPNSAVAGAFHHLPARELGAIDRTLDADVLVAADLPAAAEAALALVGRIPGLRGVFAGSLSSCAAIEAFTAVLLNVNVLRHAHASIKLTGLPDDHD